MYASHCIKFPFVTKFVRDVHCIVFLFCLEIYIFHVWYVYRICTLQRTEKLSKKGSKRLFGTLPKTSKWLPNGSQDTFRKQSCLRANFGLSKTVSKSFQNNPKINTPWRRPSGITFCSIWKLRREVLRRNLIYFSKVFHMPISSLAHLQFLKDVPSVLRVFDNRQCSVFA